MGGLGVLYVFSRFMPCASVDEYPVTDSLENSWTQALHVAFLNHFQFGQDIVFTYGPWGFLARGYHPGTFWTASIAWFVLSVVFMLAGWRVARCVSGKYLLAGIWLVMFASLATIPLGEDINTRIIAWCVLLLLLYFFIEDREFTLCQALLAVSLGWMSLIKFTGFAEGFLVVTVIATDNIFRRRRYPWILVCWLGGIIFFWWLAGQHLDRLATFFYRSWQITIGYTEAMMLTDRNECWRAAGFAAIAFLGCLLIARSARKRLNHFGLLPLAAFLGLLFITFKLGYVRSGWQHECTSALVLVLVALAGFAMRLRTGKQVVWPVWGLLVLALFFASLVFGRWFPGDGLGVQVAATFQPANIFAPIAVATTDYLKDKDEERLAKERKECPVTTGTGTVDLYSYDQNILFAHELRYQPRPVIQSYSAYTPELAELNAAHLRNAKAADSVLFAIQPVDGRFPSLEDALSWPELLTRYDLAGTNGKFLNLVRSPLSRQFKLISLTSLTIQMGKKVRVPISSNGIIWVEMEINQTLAGRIISVFYKPSILTLSVTLSDGLLKDFRLVPGMARGGFLLSPLVTDNDAFATLAAENWRQKLAGNAVESISVSEKHSSAIGSCYQSSFHLRFYRLEFLKQ